MSLEKFREQQGRHSLGYGSSKGQLGAMKAGDVDAVVCSPPYADSMETSGGIDPSKSKHIGGPHSQMNNSDTRYGHTPGQIGQESGTTYWEAVRDVYAECYKVLKPGGVLVVVVKSYVKAGRRVPLPMQTLKLLIHLGFEPLERIKAMLVKEEVSAGLFGEIRKVKERKSFFRRNHEFKQAAKEYWPTIPRDKRAKYIWSNRHKSKKRTRVIEIAQCAALNSYRKEGNTIGHLAKKNRIDFEEVLVCKRPK
uniref:Putative methyltransferase n=1 Tax=viral metagenome TaxID=1070528 RepID=A0A6H1ZXL9_9ZZZZ